MNLSLSLSDQSISERGTGNDSLRYINHGFEPDNETERASTRAQGNRASTVHSARLPGDSTYVFREHLHPSSKFSFVPLVVLGDPLPAATVSGANRLSSNIREPQLQKTHLRRDASHTALPRSLTKKVYNFFTFHKVCQRAKRTIIFAKTGLESPSLCPYRQRVFDVPSARCFPRKPQDGCCGYVKLAGVKLWRFYFAFLSARS
jgi:hypothetical protein